MKKECIIFFLIAIINVFTFLSLRGQVDEYKSLNLSGKNAGSFLIIEKVNNRFYCDFPDILLDKDFIIISRISKSAVGIRPGMMGYKGDEIGRRVIRFHLAPNDKLFLKSISFLEKSSDSSENGLYGAVENSNFQPIVYSFDIKKKSRENTESIKIDVTNLISDDNDIMFFSGSVRNIFQLGSFQPDKSYVGRITSYPTNVEIKTIKTYSTSSGFASFEINTSITLLPNKIMSPRYLDSRIGYLHMEYKDFDEFPMGVKKNVIIHRWRLEPKPEDIDKYLRGELVEPEKPIVFYIDPSTPQKWVSFMIKGVNGWQKAFEKAGFKNAIYAKEVSPAEMNNSWNPEDSRYSAIVYEPSAIYNAQANFIFDPRSGEILCAHVNWYHNMMKLLRNWYFVQASAVDKKLDVFHFDDELMGLLIQYVISHEVGHALGLKHNFGASSSVPVDSLRSKYWVEKNSICPSIMDYARFNYVAQPEDQIPRENLIVRIGDYDKWAIEWGYKWFPDTLSSAMEKDSLRKLADRRLVDNTNLFFGDETDLIDPRIQNEDLGNDPMRASLYGIKNMKLIVPSILKKMNEADEDYPDTEELYSALVAQYQQYLDHVAKYIGGITKIYVTKGKKKEVIPKFVERDKQREALKFLQSQLFTTPLWMVKCQDNAERMDRNLSNTILNFQNPILDKLIDANTLGRLLDFEACDPIRAYKASEMIKDLQNGIWSELFKEKSIDIYRRNIQKLYIKKISELVNPNAQPNNSSVQFRVNKSMQTNDILSLLKGNLRNLYRKIKESFSGIKDTSTRYHLQDCLERIKTILK